MGMTAVEKMFAAKSGAAVARAGEIVSARFDRVLLNDASGQIALTQLRAMGAKRLPDTERIVLVGDHFAPPKDVAAADGLRALKFFARDHGIRHHYGVGDGGIEHTLMPERGLVRPGDLIVGGDSHTCTAGAFAAFGIGMGSTDIAAAMATGSLWFTVPETIVVELHGRRRPFVTGKDLILAVLRNLSVDGAAYRCLEFTGPVIATLNMDERMALCNMAAEAGAKTCVVPVDATTDAWSTGIHGTTFPSVTSDADAAIHSVVRIDISDLQPLCAHPYSPDNVHPVEDSLGVKVDQVYIGNCANGTLTDLRQAASVLAGRKVADGVRCIVVPATQRIFRTALQEGLIDALVAAGAVISPSTCGACAGLHMGVMTDGEVTIATTNRNYRGRMGSPGSRVYLANAWVAASAAVAGEITRPMEPLR